MTMNACSSSSHHGGATQQFLQFAVRQESTTIGGIPQQVP
jgi:hypothetical protein